jgi:hypothetical protein
MTPAQEQAARLLARGITLRAIAAKLAIPRSEMEAWLQEPEFVALCARRREVEERLIEYRLPALKLRIIEELCRQLASANPKSVQAALAAGVRLLTASRSSSISRTQQLDSERPEAPPRPLSPGEKAVYKEALTKARELDEQTQRQLEQIWAEERRAAGVREDGGGQRHRRD